VVVLVGGVEMGCSSTWTHRLVLQITQSPIYY